MSYSLKHKCDACINKGQCIDSILVQGAISSIHMINYANGVPKQLHLGAGSIEIQCCNFKDESTKECINK